MPPLTPHMPLLQDLRCDAQGLTALGSFCSAVDGIENGRIQIDCSLVEWIDANMAAALGGVVAKLNAKGNHVTFVNLHKKIIDILSRNGFLTPRTPDRYGTVIPLKAFTLSDGKVFARYADENLQGHGIPKMSDGLRARFLQGLNEIFNNCVLHSNSKHGVYACGQAFPRASVLDFSIADMGVGFKANVSRYFGVDYAASAAIDWAMTDQNTTRSGDIPGGLGLKILKEFITLNKGSLTIYSDKGFWRQDAHGVSHSDLPQGFPGTFVNIRINTGDKSMYRLKSEADPNSFL